MKRAFTLIELMVAVGILALLLSLAFSMFNMGNLGLDTSRIQLRLQQEARRGMEAMVRDLYQASATNLTVDLIGNRVIFKVPVVVSPDTDIYDENGNIRWGAEGNANHSIRYSREGSSRQLIREIIDDATNNVITTVVCANNLQQLRLRRFPNPPQQIRGLIITITCQKYLRGNSGTQLSAELESQVSFRN